VPEVTPRSHTIADELFEFFRFRETTLLGAREKKLPVEAYVENTPLTWHESYFAQL